MEAAQYHLTLLLLTAQRTEHFDLVIFKHAENYRPSVTMRDTIPGAQTRLIMSQQHNAMTSRPAFTEAETPRMMIYPRSINTID